jgi:hypothetical protein
MPNDAKLGLLAGVIGVIAVAVVSANRPAPANPPSAPVPVVLAPGTPSSAASTDQPTVAVGSKPAVPGENTSPPIARTKTEPDGTPAGRTAKDDIDR